MKNIVATVVVAGLLAGGARAAGGGVSDDGVGAQHRQRVATLADAEYTEMVAGDAAAALKIYQQLLPTAGDERAKILLGVIRCNRKLGHHDEARQAVEQALAAKPGPAEKARLEIERRLLEPKSQAIAALAEKYVDKLNRLTPGERQTMKRRVERRVITLEAKKVRLDEFATMIGKKCNVNVSVSPAVADRRVSVRLESVDGPSALRSVAAAAGARVARWGSTYTIATAEQLKALGLEAIDEEQPAAVKPVLLEIVVRERADGQVLAKPKVITKMGQEAQVRIKSTRSDTAGDGKTLEITVVPRSAAGDAIDIELDCSISKTTRTTSGSSVQQTAGSSRLKLSDGRKGSFGLGPSPEESRYVIDVTASRIEAGKPLR